MYFITFEGNEFVIGMSFAADDEANKFAENLAICVEDLGGTAERYGGGGGGYAPPTAAPPTQAYNPPPAAPAQAYNPPPAMPPSNDAPTTQAPMRTTPITNPDTSSTVPKGAQKKKKGKFGFFRSKKQKKPAAEMVIGGPTDFKHESHIGWDMENGFDIRNIPPEWRKLFQAAGVKKSDLQDADTRKLIVSTINSNLGGDAPPPPAPAAPPPPPAPNAPPPPPAPTGPPAVGGGLAAALAAKRDNLANAA